MLIVVCSMWICVMFVGLCLMVVIAFGFGCLVWWVVVVLHFGILGILVCVCILVFVNCAFLVVLYFWCLGVLVSLVLGRYGWCSRYLI